MTLKQIQALQRENESLKKQIEAQTVQFVDDNGVSFDQLTNTVMQQLDVETKLVNMVALFQAIEYRPVFNGLDGLSI